MTKFEQRISNYMDAAFPVIYVHTFEEEKAKEAFNTPQRVFPASPF